MSASAFASDLRAAREARGTTLEQIQQQTRIPTDVLRRFEEGRLLDDPTYNEVYLKAFLKSYAGALGVPVADVMDAYDEVHGGRYDGRLHPDHIVPADPPGRRPASEPPRADAPRADAPQAEPPRAAETAPPAAPAATPPSAPPSTPAPAVAALSASPRTARTAEQGPSTPSARPVSGTRVARPAVPGARRSFDKNWGTILGLFAGFVVLLGAALWYVVFRDDAPPPDDAPRAADGSVVAVDTSGIGRAAGAGPRLQVPIVVNVTAAEGALSPFRVTADGDARRPYWIETQQTTSFQADSLLVLWGEGDDLSFADAMVDFQGLRWRPADGRPVRITPATGQALLDSLARSQP